MLLMEDEVAVDVEAAHGYGLGDSPLDCTGDGAADGCHGEVFGGAPEGYGGVVVAGGASTWTLPVM